MFHGQSTYTKLLCISLEIKTSLLQAEQGGMKPQLTKAVYAETSKDHKATSNLENALIAPNMSATGTHCKA